MRIALFFSLILLAGSVVAQNTTLTGKITDKKTKEALFGVNIVLDDNSGGTTNDKGIFEIAVKPGRHTVNFFYIGYKKESRTIFVRPGESIEQNISLEAEAQLISEIVVSAGKYEQKLSDVIVSMEVIKSTSLENTNTFDMDQAINQVPGVDVVDDQPSIRGGSGYSYGAGSRVLLLVDDLPVLSADAGDPKWNFLPVENVSQIEILKGASSVLYGSSALNGVINVRTAFPGELPKTKVSVYNGIYMNPARASLRWREGTQPLFVGTNVFHSRQIGNLDLVVGGHMFSNDGYRENENEERARINMNIRYRDKKVKGLAYGINTNLMGVDKNDFFLWQNADSGGYRQNPDGMVHTKGIRFNTDPFITYFDDKDNRHSLKTRCLYYENNLPEDTMKNSRSTLYYMDYQFQKKFVKQQVMTLGYTTAYGDVRSFLFNNHYSTNIAIYAQLDWKYKKLNVSGGLRGEYFKIDREESKSVIDGDTIKDLPVQPVFRLGTSYELAKYTFLRASYGQGYRFPSIAEKYISTNLSLLKIFPNPKLKAETGWSGEIGIKQGFKVSNWNGYIDVAGFWQEYREMMEFTFGFYDPETFKKLDPSDSADLVIIGLNGFEALGFQSINVGRAKITGIDMTITGAGTLFGLPATLLAGYTFTNPIDLNQDSTKSTNERILKYRYYHSAKADLEVRYNNISIGASMLYRSNMINIDEAFEGSLFGGSSGPELLPGLKEYRAKHNKGYIVFDFRLAYNLTEYSRLTISCKNILNAEYMGRPGDIGAPRNVSLQYSFNF
ncbi:MAG: hypothetical protein CVU05_11360 [Bacteroidetes bacterium HGW-Bacteroidetes-21]|jgi:iron complex outermembrane receptor protein|nr:MAG: hypothetical protein CVU05_11360 [Bacteroidetes bacterium HGW-Bacteroidetes-21]